LGGGVDAAILGAASGAGPVTAGATANTDARPVCPWTKRSCHLSDQRHHEREDASSMVTAGATANTTKGTSRASRESGWVGLCSYPLEKIQVGRGDAAQTSIDSVHGCIHGFSIGLIPCCVRWPRQLSQLSRNLLSVAADLFPFYSAALLTTLAQLSQLSRNLLSVAAVILSFKVPPC